MSSLKILFQFFCPLIIISFLQAEVTQLGSMPDWEELNVFQEQISRAEFCDALENVYCPREEWWRAWIVVGEDAVRVRKQAGKDDWLSIRFRKVDQKPRESSTGNLKNFNELIIAIDPGHIGGEWSQMERRHFHLGTDHPVKEGDLTYQVAQRLQQKLEQAGATSSIIRQSGLPVTKRRPADFMEEARGWVKVRLGAEDNQSEEYLLQVKERAELLFYRVDEIQQRAKIINHSPSPDLVVCLHLNAAPWKNDDRDTLVERNDYHVLVNGCYMGGELAYDDQRFEMLVRLFTGWHKTELHVAEKIASAFDYLTPMPAFAYRGPNALKVGAVDGVWARNLLANRIYRAPVVFLEPYVVNSAISYEHLLLGEYKGEKVIHGVPRKCLIEEYVEAVFKGIQNAFPSGSR